MIDRSKKKSKARRPRVRARRGAPTLDPQPVSRATEPAWGHRILFVEDHPAEQRNYRPLLEAGGRHEVVLVENREEAEAALTTGQFCLVVTDLGIPGGPGGSADMEEGLDLIGEIRARFPSGLPVLVNSAQGGGEAAALGEGAHDYHSKWSDDDELESMRDKWLLRGCEAANPDGCPNCAPRDA